MSKIIVGVDQSERSNDAVLLASSVAGITGAELMLVNVFDYDTAPSRAINDAFETYLRNHSKRCSSACAQRARRGRRSQVRRQPLAGPWTP